MSQISYLGLWKKVFFFDRFYFSEQILQNAVKRGKSTFFVHNPATNCMEMVDIMLNNYDIAPKVIFAVTRGPMGEIWLIRPFLPIFVNFLYLTIGNCENLGNWHDFAFFMSDMLSKSTFNQNQLVLDSILIPL